MHLDAAPAAVLHARSATLAIWRRLRSVAAAAALMQAVGGAWSAPVPDELLQAVRSGPSVGVIVEFDATAIDRDADTRRARLPRRVDDPAALAQLASRYRALKNSALQSLQRSDVQAVRDYSHLPLSFKRVSSEAGLRALASTQGVAALHVDRLHQHVLAQSLPLVGQPVVGAAGLLGAGSTVVVIDSGVDLSNPAFGGCTAVGTPVATCRIAYLQDIAVAPTSDHSHGTNVAAVVLGVAPAARIASLNVFGSAGAYSSDILAAINWAINNAPTLNIAAINMSLGDGTHSPSPCSATTGPSANPYLSAVTHARNAGISVEIAAGNSAYGNGTFVNGISSPACTPGAISVGAVYDSNLGGLSWSGRTSTACIDGSTAANQVACFSQDASYLSLLAPGALITAAGYKFGGTSQATPHVAGAVAVLHASFPNESLSSIESRLTASGTPLVDSRTGRTHPRLNLAAAARPTNDDFATAIAVTGHSGTTLGGNRLATLESGEPLPVGVVGQTVWWQWTAPASGQMSLDTLGSSFDTRLDVYTGNSVGTLAQIAGNDNTDGASSASSLRFQAQTGVTYRWAVGTATGAAGDVSLAWSLNPLTQANLSVTLGGPSGTLPGDTVIYTLTVSNAGPQSATGVIANVTIPAGIAVLAVPASCSAQTTAVTCNLGEVASGASLSLALSVRIDAPASLIASLTSDVPDPVPGDNTVTAFLAPGDAASADIPTLPQWGLLLLGGVLLGCMQARQRAPARMGGGSGIVEARRVVSRS
ncbi:MAG: IPTL-CTERM sorting domain-containing protein [Pseudomonadota bacterium]|nr:IPTL-CTERM sorting domain-containing protein [Pseudomonadota bacterium]